MSGPIQVIFNADDFAFTRDVNDGIVEAYRRGVLTATTLMANGNAFEHAVVCVGQNPALDIGVHLVLVQGESVAHPGRLLPATLQDLAKALIRHQLNPYEEAAAQVRKIVAAGIRPTHVDTHKHTHLFPSVLGVVARIAREFNIPWVRRPFDYGAGSGAAMTKRAVAKGLQLMRPRFAKVLAGLRTTDYFTGFGLTGTLDEAGMIATLESLPPGLTEFMCHPGHCGPELRSAATRLRESRAIELAALTSPAVRRVIDERGMRLISYRSVG